METRTSFAERLEPDHTRGRDEWAPEHADDLVTETAFAILGGAKRTGEWTPPELLHVVAVMGGVELDFRRALLGGGVVEVRIFAVMGGVTITVPRNLELEVTATAILGGVDQRSRAATDVNPPQTVAPCSAPAADDPRPLLLISGVAIMGGITIRVD